MADYVWILIACAGLILVAGEAKRFVAQRDLILSEAVYKSDFSRTLNNARFNYSYFNVGESVKAGNIIKADNKAVKWFKELEAALAEGYESDKWIEILKETKINELDQSLYPNRIVKEMFDELNNLKTSYDLYLKNKSDVKLESYEKIFIIIYPFFLALALALKFTKVSKELFIYNTSSTDKITQWGMIENGKERI